MTEKEAVKKAKHSMDNIDDELEEAKKISKLYVKEQKIATETMKAEKEALEKVAEAEKIGEKKGEEAAQKLLQK